jgi:hypothetical protein
MDERLSVALIAALARVWTSIRTKHPGVPGVVILAAPGSRDQPRVLGHFAALRWNVKEGQEHQVHEVVVVAEYLNRPAEDVVETLLHEAAHAMNFERGIRDCSRSQYHNAHFKAAAEEIGLTVNQVPHYGYAHTTLPPATAEQYREDVEALRSFLIHRRRLMELPTKGPGTTGGTDDNDDGRKEPSSRARKATCQCPFIIRVSKKVMESTTIRCDRCGQPFAIV